jgi:hypothetical protein
MYSIIRTSLLEIEHEEVENNNRLNKIRNKHLMVKSSSRPLTIISCRVAISNSSFDIFEFFHEPASSINFSIPIHKWFPTSITGQTEN